MQQTDLDFAAGGVDARVSALLLEPSQPAWLYVMAHGAGAGMRHPFMEQMAERLAERDIATFRFQFPYMQAGAGRPDSPSVLERTIASAVEAAATARPGLPLLAGGKSLGGRMTSHAAASRALPAVRGLVFLGFPLHAPGKPGVARAGHLGQVAQPMLFLQGTRDALADLQLIRSVTAPLGERSTVYVVEGGDHSFKVPKRSGRTEQQVLDELSDVISRWAAALPLPARR
jgi:predicted alpha/beta-hydrolase family hydrolase